MWNRFQLVILGFFVFVHCCQSQNPYGRWQILDEYELQFFEDTFLITENDIPRLNLWEAYSSIHLNGSTYLHSGSFLFKNKKVITDSLDGHNSSSQGSFLLANQDSTYLFIIYTHSQFMGNGLNMSVLDTRNDSFLIFNKSLNTKGGELLDVVVMSDTIHIFNNSIDGNLVHLGIDRES